MGKLTRARTFAPEETQRKLAERELAIFLEALSHDTQYAVRHLCWLIQILHLPARISREAQIQELTTRLALFREKLAANPHQRWIGRPWSSTQLRRIFYARGRGFRRPSPQPVTRDELAAWVPLIPPAELNRRAAGTSKQGWPKRKTS